MIDFSRVHSIATKLATGVGLEVSVVQAAEPNNRPFVLFARLTSGAHTTANLRIGGRIMRADAFDGEALFVGNANEAIDVDFQGAGADGSYLVTYGLLQADVPGTSD